MKDKKNKILFIDSTHSVLKAMLEKHGFSCDDGTKMNKKEILSIIGEYSGIIVRSRITIDRKSGLWNGKH
jgi:hypothetical protein